MSNLNLCQFIGRAGKEPEVRFTAAGQCVASLSIAVSEKFKNKSGETEERTEWINLTFWGKLGELVGQLISKGTLIYVSGKFQTRKWTDRDGKDRYSSEVNCDRMQLLSSKDGGKPRSGGDGSRTYDATMFDDSADIPFLCAPGINDPY